MAQIRPKILLRYGRINEPLRVPMIDLIIDSTALTYLASDLASGQGTLSVLNITAFSTNQVLLIGEPGNQNSEIIKTHASSAPSGTTITLASNTVNAHSAGTIVRVINFDQVELSNAPTVGGSKSVLVTSSLVANALETTYNDTASTGGFYYARFKNSISSAFSSYSDPAPYSGYTQMSARWVIDSALSDMNKKTTAVLSDEFAFQKLNDFQTEVLKEQKRWDFMQNFNANLGQAGVGTWRVAVPTDLDEQYSNQSTWNFRIGKQENMTWVDKEKWNDITAFIAHSTLSAILNVGDSSMTLASSSDFDDSGTVQIGAYTYAYTANNRTTGVLTLSAVVPSGQNQASGADVFEGATPGEPRYWTLFGGYIWMYPIISSDYTNRNLYLDYYKAQTLIVADSDLLVIPDQTAAIAYLKWKFLEKLNSGKPTPESTAQMQIYVDRKMNIKRKNTIGRTFRLKPRKNSLNMDQMPGDDPKWVRVGAFPNS